MIEKYQTAAMSRIWSLETQYELWWEVERAALKGWVEIGEIPETVMEEVDEKVEWSVERIKEHEARTRHDMLAFLETLEESVGELSAHIHRGLTSADVKDTAKAIQISRSIELLEEELEGMLEVLADLAETYRGSVLIGRTHGVHAEPTTFGLKCLIWLEEWRRQQQRLGDARAQIKVGKISGAVGTYANLDPRVEEIACRELGLEPAPVSSQILQRDRHAHVLCTLANMAGTLEKMAEEVRNLQRTEILEVQEGFRAGQKGSSAMPHKKNPIVSERLCGQARLMRSYAGAMLETQSLWHERDLTNSSTERIAFPDAFHLMHYMLQKGVAVFENLRVNEDRMEANLWETHGLIFSQRVMLTLSRAGMDRSRAYEITQELAMQSWNHGQDFEDLVRGDERVRSTLDETTLEACFDVDQFVRHEDAIYQRVLGEGLDG